MDEQRQLTFGPFRLDLHDERLWRSDRAIPLTAKTFAVLRYLVEHAGQLVTRDALLEAVWGTLYVSDAALASCIRDIRRALDDAAQQPQYLETVRSRGYRFLLSVHEAAPLPLSERAFRPQQSIAPPSPFLVGREVELTQLHEWFAAVLQGQRQFVFVTGEAGIGKTTLVEAFIAQVAATQSLWLSHGQCIEHHGAGEAYLPLLEALGHLGRASDGQHLVELLRQYAPSWLLHLPAVVSASEIDILQRRAGSATQERMLRELAEAVEALTAERPLVLVLEDLHWSDGATLDWLAYVARRRMTARLLVLATYRPAEAALRAHPVHPMVQELQVHGQCVELVLDYFSEAAVAAYLTQRLAHLPLPGELTRVLHQRTTGNPLFLAALVEALVRQGMLREGTAGWELAGGLETITAEVPESLRQMMERQIEQLMPEEQMLLEAASVAGKEFAVAAVAVAVGGLVDDVEARCAALARRRRFLRECGTDVWADGTVASRYGFLHDLYRETLYERVPASRQMRWHQQIGRRLEAGYGLQTPELAVELAEHFVRGRDTTRAVQYLHLAGEQALQRSAQQEAMVHLTRALELLAALPETPARAQQELAIQLTLGAALNVTRGAANPEVEQAYSRARALCVQVGETPQLVPMLRGLWRFYLNRGALSTARELAEQLVRLAPQAAQPTHLLEAHEALGTTCFYLGDFATARMHLELGMSHIDPTRSQVLRESVAPAVSCLAKAALTLWHLGFPAQAVQRSQEALTLAQTLAHAHSLAYALRDAALLYYRRREAPVVLAQVEEILALATAQELRPFVEYGRLLRGWALAVQGQGEADPTPLRQSLAAVVASGQTLVQGRYLALLAEALASVGQIEAGLRLLAEALTVSQGIGQGDLLAEVYRLQGDLLLQHTLPDAPRAADCLHQALVIARGQQARSWELRAATSLSRLWQQQGKQVEARQLLAEIYGWFTEGFDTPDLQEARKLLDTLT